MYEQGIKTLACEWVVMQFSAYLVGVGSKYDNC